MVSVKVLLKLKNYTHTILHSLIKRIFDLFYLSNKSEKNSITCTRPTPVNGQISLKSETFNIMNTANTMIQAMLTNGFVFSNRATMDLGIAISCVSSCCFPT